MSKLLRWGRDNPDLGLLIRFRGSDIDPVPRNRDSVDFHAINQPRDQMSGLVRIVSLVQILVDQRQGISPEVP
mgnify:CR=1 FL=1|jgi:hypothetical protein